MVLLTLIILVALCGQVRLTDSSLELVHVVMRHCDRTPVTDELYIKSPYYNESTYHPYGYGQLTNAGKKRCYEIGTALRKRYDGFLNSSYHYTLVEGRSTYYGRCKESLQLVLAGLFPPTPELTWLDGMNWLPIATYYERRELDKVLFPLAQEILEKEEANFLQTEEGKVFSAPFKELMETVSKNIGEPVTDFERMGFIALGIGLVDELGLPLPDWIKPLYPNPIKESYRQFLASKLGSKKLRRLLCSYFFKKLVEDTEMKINGTLSPANRKMFIYSAHDLNILTLFAIMDIFDTEAPPVGAYSLLEVHNINGTYGVKLFYQNFTSTVPYPIDIPGFGQFAPLDKLKMQKQEYLHVDDLFVPSYSTRSASNLFSVVFLISSILLL